MKTRSNEPVNPFVSVKVEKIYEIPQSELNTGNPPEYTYFNIPKTDKTGKLNNQFINPIADPDLLPTIPNLRTGNRFEYTNPGFEIRKSHFETIIGPNPLNLQNAYNSNF